MEPGMSTVLDPHVAFAAAIRRLFPCPGDLRANSAMRAASDSGVPGLHKGAIVAVPCPLQHEIACLRGSLWITHDGDPKDVVLEAGQSYRSDRRARMLIQALEDAYVRVAVAGHGLPRS
jgi:hypothetical protein